VGQIGDVDRGGERAAPRIGDHEAIALQSLQRFAHRRAPRAEFLGERVVVQRVTWPDVQHDQSISDPLVRPVRERRRSGQLCCETHDHPLTTSNDRPTVHR
jgi:hypothetical protein